MNEDLLKDGRPATVGMLYAVVRVATDLIKEIHGGKIAALERRISDLEEQATQPNKSGE